MTSLKLLRLASTRSAVPSLNGPALSDREQRSARMGMCVACGDQPQSDTSFRCAACEAGDSAEAIAADLQALRKRLLMGSPDKGNT